MARKKKAEAVEEIVEETKEQPVVEEQKVEEPTSPNEVKEDGTLKVDLDKWAKIKKEDKSDVAKVDLSKKEETKEEVKEEPVEEVKEEEKTEEVVEETPAVEEITEIEVEEKTEELQEAVEEAVVEAQVVISLLARIVGTQRRDRL